MGIFRCRGAAGMGEGGGCFWWERRGCSVWGSSCCAGLLDSKEGRGCLVWGSSRCAELLGWGMEDDAAFWGAPAARGCSIKGRGCFMGIFHCRAARSCAELLKWGREEARCF